MLGDGYTPETLPMAVGEVKKVLGEYPTMAGVCLWEYGDTGVDPVNWATQMLGVMR